MRAPSSVFIFAGFALLACALMAARASAKSNPLQRGTPVPADQPIPVIDFFRPGLFAQPRLNPTGTHFAALVSTVEDKTDVVLYEFATKKFERLTGFGNLDIYDFTWLSDRALSYSTSREKYFHTSSFVAELGRLKDSFTTDEWRRWQSRNAAKGSKETVYVRGVLNQLGPSTTRALEDLFRISADPNSIALDKDGHPAFAILPAGEKLRLYRYSGGKWLESPVDCEATPVLAPGDRADEAIVLEPRQEGRPRALRRMNLATGELGEVLLQTETHDPVGVQVHRDPADGRIVGVHFTEKITTSRWFDESFSAASAALESAFPEKLVRIVDSDQAKQKFLAATWSDREPSRYYLYNRGANTIAPVAPSAPWIDPARMAPMRTLSFKTRDGVELEGYVTLPAGVSKENPAPLVVLPHGGPWVRDIWGWDAETQFLASRGYAVFQPNYRGSAGYEFRVPSDDDWAFLKMHHDVTDGVQTLLRTGLIDSERLAIMGWSFGAYLAMTGAAFEPDMYRCAVSLAGVFDWEQLMREAQKTRHRKIEYQRFRRHLGDPRLDREKFEQISPLHHADRIKIPVFVAHGRDDPTVSVAHSKKLVATLKRRRVPVETQFESGEGHGFRHLDNRVQLYSAIEAFLQEHLAPRKR